MILSLLGVFREVVLWTKLSKKCFIFYIFTHYLVNIMHPWLYYERGALNVSAYRFCFEKERKSDLVSTKMSANS